MLPKTYLPNYGEFYEGAAVQRRRQRAVRPRSSCAASACPSAPTLLFQSRQLPLLKLHVEICEDVWVPIPPSSYAALAGATVLVNLSASNITIGKSDYRHRLVSLQSARCLAAYLYSSAGIGESTTDLAWDGQALIYESGEMLAESERFSNRSHIIMADVDLERLSRERMRQNSFGVSAQRHKAGARAAGARSTSTCAPPPRLPRRPAAHAWSAFPTCRPIRRSATSAACEVFNIQVQSLVQRLEASRHRQARDRRLGRTRFDACAARLRAGDGPARPAARQHPRLHHARLRDQRAHAGAGAPADGAASAAPRARSTSGPSCRQMLDDLGHPFADGVPQYDITFENVQAGERTSHLFRLANLHNGIVVGTGDLSELALGWCTYGVGDHMSHYNVNASVPKTLIKHLVRWVAAHRGSSAPTAAPCCATSSTPRSAPSWCRPMHGAAARRRRSPASGPKTSSAPTSCRTSTSTTRCATASGRPRSPSSRYAAWHDRAQGRWPDDACRPSATSTRWPTSSKHLGTFLYRFFKTSQFKRSCVPNAPKVGSGGSLSPRGDWRAPSDSEAEVWLEDLKRVPESG